MVTEIAYDDMFACIGREFGPTKPIQVTQQMIDGFADLTLDHQWVHVDVERANKEIGGTIVHGFLTLSLIPYITEQLLVVTGVGQGFNYGLNKVRFPAPVVSGSYLCGSVKIADVEEKTGGLLITRQVTIREPDAEKPACIAELLALYLPGEGTL